MKRPVHRPSHYLSTPITFHRNQLYAFIRSRFESYNTLVHIILVVRIEFCLRTDQTHHEHTNTTRENEILYCRENDVIVDQLRLHFVRQLCYVQLYDIKKKIYCKSNLYISSDYNRYD